MYCSIEEEIQNIPVSKLLFERDGYHIGSIYSLSWSSSINNGSNFNNSNNGSTFSYIASGSNDKNVKILKINHDSDNNKVCRNIILLFYCDTNKILLSAITNE